MYESFFGFEKRPFLTVPTLDRYFPAFSIEQAYQTVARAIQRGEGPVAIFGGAGLGKTMCCMRVADSISKRFEVITLASSQIITRRALLQSLLYELRMPFREMSEGELRLTLLERLQPSDEHHLEGLVLVVDEAQTLSTKLLDELRLLTNIVNQGVPRVRLVLSGTMKLEEILAHPHMESLNQRLAARCYLTPLSHEETARYVTHKIELCGVRLEDAMSHDALEAIYRASDGIPRLIDQVADQALLQASLERIRPINAAVIGYAWSLLQQLPNPWSDPIPRASTLTTNHALNGGALDSDDSSVEFYEDEENHVADPLGTEPYRSPFSSIEFGALDEPAAVAPCPIGDLAEDNFAEDNLAEDNFAEDNFTEENFTEENFTEQNFAPENLIGESFSEENADAHCEQSLEQPLESRFEQPLLPSTENLLRSFEEGFDDEFSIPIQSVENLQSLTGIALGDLNHDALAFEDMQRADMDDAYPEAAEFLDLRIDAPQNAEEGLPSTRAPNWLYSNVSMEQFGEIEQQIEEEMRDLVSNLNLSAMTIERAESNQLDIHSFHDTSESGLEGLREPHRSLDSGYPLDRGTVSFAGLHDSLQSRNVQSDDRDMIVIDDGMQGMLGSATGTAEPSVRASIHPYAQLFSKLR